MTVAVREILAEDYHRHPALSSSGARKLLPPSCPALFKWEQDHPVDKWEFDFGRAAHKIVLGDDLGDEIKIIEAKDWRTKKAQTERDEARANKITPILRPEWDRIQDMADAIRRHPLAARLLDPEGGKAEQSLFWIDQETGIECRTRIDWLRSQRRGRLLIVDYKTAESAEKSKFAKSAMNYGYHQQAAFYMDGVKAVGLDPDPGFLFIVQERVAPYLVNVVEIDPADIEIGRFLNRRALHIYAECIRTDHWPSYNESDIDLASFPGWYRAEFEEDEL